MLKSASRELRWPAVIPQEAAPVYIAFSQLDHSQWLPAATLRQLQSRQLAARLQHAASASRYFAPLLNGKDLHPVAAFNALAELPPLKRGDLQLRAREIFCATSSEHGEVGEARTSGSSGEPVTVRYTAAAQVLRNALSLRTLGWHQLNVGKVFAIIRASIPLQADGSPARYTDWNPFVADLFGSAPAFGLSISLPIEQQLAVLRAERPAYLMTYPSNLRGLLELSPENPCGLEVLMCVGETLAADLREALISRWGVAVRDEYSAEETGPIASQCERGLYHCMGEGLHVEVVREDGSACAPGEIGRVLVTDLRNFATALLRYDIRDYAQVGAPCDCGRGLPTLQRIVGRERNLLRLPDGRRFWPMFGLRREEAAGLVRQFQILQTSLNQLELRVWPYATLTPAQRDRLSAIVQESLGFPLAIVVEEFNGPLPMGRNGKFQEFECLLDS